MSATTKIPLLPGEVVLFEEFILNWVGKMIRMDDYGNTIGVNDMSKVTLDSISRMGDTLTIVFSHDDPIVDTPCHVDIPVKRVSMYLNPALVAVLAAYGLAYQPNEGTPSV